jgi:hypothetical protein
MDTGLLLTINLKGRIGGPLKHTDKQLVTVDVAPLGKRHPEWITRKIKHTDRVVTSCSRKLHISEEVVNSWIHSDCPHWERVGAWKNMNEEQRMLSFIKNFDEGHGVTFELV